MMLVTRGGALRNGSVDNRAGTAAGGRSASSAAAQVSGCGPSAVSSGSCMAHQGETDRCPERTAPQN
jgi:hypothetical protein